MMNNSFKIMFFMILMMGTLITISANSWLSAWMGLEMNLLSFIPLMSDNNLLSTEASLKYFLTQALASIVLLFSVIMTMLDLNLLENFNSKFLLSILLSALLMKMGAAPFHFWYPNLMEGLSWNNVLILMTWQKLAPMILVSYIMNFMMMSTTIILSTLIGALGGLNQTSLRKLMAFSSINHLGWMMMAMQINQSIWLIYFFIYCLLSIIMVYYFNMFKISHLKQMFSAYFISKPLKFIMFLNLLSLGGLPPFLGFFPKWMVIQLTSYHNFMFMMLIMMMSTLITLYFYLRMCYSAFLLNYTEINWINNMQFNKNSLYIYVLLSFISIFGLIFIPMFYFI